MMNITFNRIIETGLENTKVNNEILASVIGQMSDGIWENSSRLNGYWAFSSIKDGNIAISEDRWDYYTNARNPYRQMTDDKIKEFFANKIKQIVKRELADKYDDKVRERFFKAHNIPEDWRWLYPTKEHDRVEACDQDIKDYLKANPFTFRGKFNADNDTELVYLNYHEKVTVADAYKAYKILVA